MARYLDDDESYGDDDYEDSFGGDGDDEGPGEHDRHLMDDDAALDAGGDQVLCPACGSMIWSAIDICPRCGVAFKGEAWQGVIAGEPDIQVNGSRIWWWLAVVVLVAMAFVLVPLWWLVAR